MARLSEISQYDVGALQINGKIIGCEGIPYANFYQSPQEVLKNSGIVSNDSKLLVFRFHQNKYRLICKSDVEDGSILYILCFDFDHSAYHH